MDILNFSFPIPKSKIETEDQAINWVNILVNEMLDYRERCNLKKSTATDKGTKAKAIRDFWIFLEKYGQVIGALNALIRVNKISEGFFTDIAMIARNTLVATQMED